MEWDDINFGIVCIIITTLTFTTLEPVSKLIASEISPFAITFIRFFIGGLTLLPFSLKQLKKKRLTLTGQDYTFMGLLGALCICISMPLLQYAVKIADSPALIAIIFSANSVFTILFAALILKDKITPKRLLAVALCVAGVLISVDFSSGTNLMSVLLAVISALIFSLYTVLSKKHMSKLTGIIQTGFSFTIGSVLLLLFLLITGTKVFSGISSSNIHNLLYLGIVVTGVGYWAYFYGMELSGTIAASLVFFIKPILTPFATFFINGIAPDGKVFAALVLVLLGSFLASVKK